MDIGGLLSKGLWRTAAKNVGQRIARIYHGNREPNSIVML